VTGSIEDDHLTVKIDECTRSEIAVTQKPRNLNRTLIEQVLRISQLITNRDQFSEAVQFMMFL